MKKVVFILSHSNGMLGRVEVLEKYFSRNGRTVVRLLHPLNDYASMPSTIRDEQGKLTSITRRPQGIRNYLTDFRLSVNYIRKYDVDLFLALSNFDTLPAIFCRNILRKKIDKIIFYPSDYSENRFNSRVMNILYRIVEKIALRYSDVVVSNTHRAESKRLADGLSRSKSTYVPNGVEIEKPIFLNKKISKSTFVYIGEVNREHGLLELLEKLSPKISKLVIIGGGKDWERTIKFAKKQKFTLEAHYKKDKKFVLEYLQKFEGFGLAPYNREAGWTYYCSPLKVGEYIACGVPVLMSQVPEVAYIVRSKRYGVTYDKLELKAISEELNEFDTGSFHLKSKSFLENYNNETLLDNLFVHLGVINKTSW